MLVVNVAELRSIRNTCRSVSPLTGKQRDADAADIDRLTLREALTVVLVGPAIAQPFLLLVRIAAVACPSAHPIAATIVAPVINALEIAAHVLLEKLPDFSSRHSGL